MSALQQPPMSIVAAIRPLCLALPEVTEQPAWVGVRWRIRTRTFAHVLAVEAPQGLRPILTFRADGEELEMLRHLGHPFFLLGWGANAMAMVLEDSTDWAEVNELLIESYCLMAPKKLASLVPRPE